MLGLYAVAATYVATVNVLPAVLGQVSLPTLVALHERGASADALARIVRWNLWLSIGASIALGALSSWALPFAFGASFAPAVTMANVLLFGAPLAATNLVLSAGFKACGKPGIASQAEAIGLIGTVSLLAMLLPRLGGLGASIASVCAYAATTCFLVWRGARVVGMRPSHLVLPQPEDRRLAQKWLRRLTGRAEDAEGCAPQ